MNSEREARSWSITFFIAIMVLLATRNVYALGLAVILYMIAGFIAFCTECRPSWKTWSLMHTGQLVYKMALGIFALHGVKILQTSKKDFFHV